ncbi:MAG: hypothetical protein FD123_3758 [Bacteroidetes bacterium]|nr:MAG: hypothetical protein FD123_3758 [Bacteroidota bacterium]
MNIAVLRTREKLFHRYIIIGLAAILLFLPSPVSAQMSDEPYYYVPNPVPINNRNISDRRIACLYETHRVKACFTVTTFSRGEITDSLFINTYATFHPNGFVDSTCNYITKKNFKYTVVGGRIVSEMIAGCGNDSLLTAKGPPDESIQAQPSTNSRFVVTCFFDANGYLLKKKKMAKGLLKHEDSWDGSWNSKTEVKIDSSGNLLELTQYLSHWWFFRAPERKFIFHYDAKGLLTEQVKINYSGRKILSVEKSKYSYLFRE